MAEIQLKAFLEGEMSTEKSPACIGILPCGEGQVPMASPKGFGGFLCCFWVFLAMLTARYFGGAPSGFIYTGHNFLPGQNPDHPGELSLENSLLRCCQLALPS